MLRLLSIRNFVVFEALDLEFDRGFTALTGETGAGKSILLDALALLLGDRFELRQLKAGADRADLAAEFDIEDRSDLKDWLAEQGLAGGDNGDNALLLRRSLDAQGKSRAWINARPATLGQMKEIGEKLVDLHGQHAHQSLLAADEQRALLDRFGGFTALALEVGASWRVWQSAVDKHDAAARAAQSFAAERETLSIRQRELAALKLAPDEWATLSQAQTRLAHAASLLETAAAGEDELAESDDALTRRLSTLISRLQSGAAHDPALLEIVDLLQPARIQLDEAARSLRGYRQKLDLDPSELARVEQRLSAIHDAGRRYRVRPDALPELLAETEARLAELAESADAGLLARRAAEAEAAYRGLAVRLSDKRKQAAKTFAQRVTASMQDLAMAGGRFEIALVPVATPASYGLEHAEFRVASHPKQPLGPLARVASGGELSRVALAIQVVSSEVGAVPTLIFDEVDAGIGGAVAATVGQLMQGLGLGAAGDVRNASAAGRRLRRYAFFHRQAQRQEGGAHRCRTSGGDGAGGGAGADAGRQRDHREDARPRQGIVRAGPAPRRLGCQKLQRHSVVAIAEPGGLRAIVEHVAMVTATARAVIFGTRIDQLDVGLGLQRPGNVIVKARPARAAVEFGARLEKR
jgi:DNA repair protein RecN (Recombination protein N)